MGGRGGYSGRYAGMDRGSLERMKSHYQGVADRNRAAAGMNPNSPSAAVRRRQKAAEKAYHNAVDEIAEIDKALKHAKKGILF